MQIANLHDYSRSVVSYWHFIEVDLQSAEHLTLPWNDGNAETQNTSGEG